MITRDFLNMICEGECDPNRYCILKEIIIASSQGKTIYQIKTIEISKYLLSKKHNREFSWQEATMDWVDSKKAEKFSQIYDPNISPIETYKRIEQMEEQEKKGLEGIVQ